MTTATLTSIVIIALAVALAPVVADLLRRWLTVPTTVLEIGFGILLGPAVLGLVRVDGLVEALSALGLALLFFLAGYEIDFVRIRGGPLRRAAGSWGVSLLLGVAAGAGLAAVVGGGWQSALILGLALATTALGAILPMVRDAGLLPTPLGAAVLAVGALGEFAPLLAVAVLLSGDRPLHSSALLATFAIAALAAAAAAMRAQPARIKRVVTATLATSAQFGVRLAILVVLAMVWLATELHLDLVLGAFAAGIVMRLALARFARPEAAQVESKLEGIGFGMLVPFFFVVTGVQLDLESLVADPAALVIVPVALVGFLLVRGIPVVVAFRHALGRVPARAVGLYASTTLPLVVVITTIGVAEQHLTTATAAGMVAAAMLSVLLFPLLAVRTAQAATTAQAAVPAGVHDDAGHGQGGQVDWGERAAQLVRAARDDQPWYDQLAQELVRPGDRTAVDAGCGAGGMTLALAAALGVPGQVVAVDATPAMLDAVGARLGPADRRARVDLVVADLNQGVEPVRDVLAQPADLVWASASLHHLGDQQAAVDALAGLLAPGGRLAVAEGGLPARHLPWDLGVGRPGLEARLQAADDHRFARMRADLPDAQPMPYGWSNALRRAGLVDVTTRTVLREQPMPLTYHDRERVLDRLGHTVAALRPTGLLDADDLAAWDRLLDPHDVAWLGHRDDLQFCDARSVHVGERPRPQS